jgi:ribosome biogenesis protein Nip4
VKRFVKGGDEGAEAYENVRVIFISGRKAVLTIYHDDKEVEQIELQTLETTHAMHELMIDRGFTKRSENELELLRQRRLQDEEKDAQKMEDRMERRKLQREELGLRRQAEKEGLDKDSPEFIKLMQEKEKQRKELFETVQSYRNAEELRNEQLKVGDSTSIPVDRLAQFEKRRLQAEEFRTHRSARLPTEERAYLEQERKAKMADRRRDYFKRKPNKSQQEEDNGEQLIAAEGNAEGDAEGDAEGRSFDEL